MTHTQPPVPLFIACTRPECPGQRLRPETGTCDWAGSSCTAPATVHIAMHSAQHAPNVTLCRTLCAHHANVEVDTLTSPGDDDLTLTVQAIA